MEIKTSARNLDKTVENVVKLLVYRRQTIATAESCTGGLLSQLITAVSGASSCFEVGVCTYANRMKEQILNVPANELEQFGAVSGEVALSMVRGLRRLSGADICVSVTGIAGPLGGTAQKPVGSVYMGYLFGETSGAMLVPMANFTTLGREDIRLGTAAFVFGEIERYLEEKGNFGLEGQ